MDNLEFDENIRKMLTELKLPNSSVSIVCTFMNLLYNELELNSDNPSVDEIVEVIEDNHNKVEKAFYKIFKGLQETKKKSTVATMGSVCRSILEKLGMNKSRLKLPAQNKKEASIFPIKIRNLPDDNKTKKFIENRLEYVQTHSGCQSDVTQKTMLRYWVGLLELFGSLDTLDVESMDLTINNVINIVKKEKLNKYHVIYLYHLFKGINDEWEKIKIKELSQKLNINKNIRQDADDEDKDRLTAKQQEDIWKACQIPIEKLMVSLLFTTGMRVNGLCNIKTANVLDTSIDPPKPLSYGNTLEKRNKIRKFPIFDMVKKPLVEWYQENHMIDSPYLFPGSRDNSKPVTTMFFQTLFKKVAERAGYTGEEIHVHSARHSVAFNLLEAGNKMNDIGKFLGHANPTTTAKFYAKLSTKETIDRMNTKCIGGTDAKKAHVPEIPSFGNEEKKKKKKSKGLSKLANVDIGGISIAEQKAIEALEKAKAKKIKNN